MTKEVNKYLKKQSEKEKKAKQTKKQGRQTNKILKQRQKFNLPHPGYIQKLKVFSLKVFLWIKKDSFEKKITRNNVLENI